MNEGGHFRPGLVVASLCVVIVLCACLASALAMTGAML